MGGVGRFSALLLALVALFCSVSADRKHLSFNSPLNGDPIPGWFARGSAAITGRTLLLVDGKSAGSGSVTARLPVPESEAGVDVAVKMRLGLADELESWKNTGVGAGIAFMTKRPQATPIHSLLERRGLPGLFSGWMITIDSRSAEGWSVSLDHGRSGYSGDNNAQGTCTMPATSRDFTVRVEVRHAGENVPEGDDGHVAGHGQDNTRWQVTVLLEHPLYGTPTPCFSVVTVADDFPHMLGIGGESGADDGTGESQSVEIISVDVNALGDAVPVEEDPHKTELDSNGDSLPVKDFNEEGEAPRTLTASPSLPTPSPLPAPEATPIPKTIPAPIQTPEDVPVTPAGGSGGCDDDSCPEEIVVLVEVAPEKVLSEAGKELARELARVLAQASKAEKGIVGMSRHMDDIYAKWDHDETELRNALSVSHMAVNNLQKEIQVLSSDIARLMKFSHKDRAAAEIARLSIGVAKVRTNVKDQGSRDTKIALAQTSTYVDRIRAADDASNPGWMMPAIAGIQIVCYAGLFYFMRRQAHKKLS